MEKKCQIFISSTFIDLVNERQQVVQAILDNGDIPAGMELFSANDESQMETIKRWIDQSDIYMLILGSRYGSIENVSKKSYTQLEYEYAIEQQKPIFSLVANYITDVNNDIINFKYIEFKNLIYSKIIKEFSNISELKYNTILSINSIKQKYNDKIIGWSRGNSDIEISSLKSDLIEIQKKYQVLNNEYTKLQKKILETETNPKIGNLSYSDIFELLENKKIVVPKLLAGKDEDLKIELIKIIDDSIIDKISVGVRNQYGVSDYEAFIFYNIGRYLVTLGLAESKKGPGNAKWSTIILNQNGKKFFMIFQKEKLKRKYSKSD